MIQTGTNQQTQYNDKILNVLRHAGFEEMKKVCDALQGFIFKGWHEFPNKKVVVKVTNKNLHNESIVIRNGKKLRVDENILMEKDILKYLCSDSKCPKCIIKYIDFFKSNINYFLILEDGGYSLFDFVVKNHKYIEQQRLQITNWHKMVKIIFKQMIQSIEYLHFKNICHFDISLENFLINNVNIQCLENGSNKFRFCINSKNRGNDIQSAQIKIIDFGLSQIFDPKIGFKTKKYCGKSLYQSPEITMQKKLFNAKSNDIFCLGVCLFMLIIGSSPWLISSCNDKDFIQIMMKNGDITSLLKKWNRINYVDHDIIDLLKLIFKYEEIRCNLSTIKNHKWLNS